MNSNLSQKNKHSENLKQEKTKQIRDLQDKITTDYIKIMADLSDNCLKIMGKAPCKFIVVGMGSLSRKEVTPYSDFEHVILLEEGVQEKSNYDKILEYFRWYSVIFHVVIINLRETILPSVSIYCLNNKDSKLGDWFYDAFTTRGISFDGMMPHACKFPLGRQEFTKDKEWKTELIKPVSEMLKYLTTEEDLKNGYHLKDILTKVCFVYGDKNIFDDFESQMYKMLEKDDEQSKRNEIKRQILEDLEKFSTRSTLPQIISSKEFNLKKVIYRSTTLFISTLGRLYNVHASSSFEIIEYLAKKNKISKNARNKLMYAVALACEIRLRWYMQCRSQNDLIKCHSMEESATKVILKLTPKQNIISYFQIAYALQCHISHKLNLKKKFFYANPELLNTTLYYCLGEMQKLIECTKQKKKTNNNQTQRLYSFDESLERLQSDNEQHQTESFFNQQKLDNPLSSRFDEEIAVAEYFFEFGTHLHKNQNYDEALDYFQNQSRMLEEIKKQTNSNRFGMELQSYGNKIHSNSRSHKSETTIETQASKEPILICFKLDYHFAPSLQDIGLCLLMMNRFDEALDYLNRSLDEFKKISPKIDSDHDIACVLSSVGLCLIQMNDFNKAIECLKQSEEILENSLSEIDSDFDMINILTNFGICFMKNQNFSKTIDYFKRCLKIHNQAPFMLHSNHVKAKLLMEIGRCLKGMRKFAQALPYLKESLVIQERISHDIDSDGQIALFSYEIGKCLMEMNEFERSLTFFKRSLKIQEKRSIGNETEFEVTTICNEAGRCLMKMYKLEEAIKYFKLSLSNQPQRPERVQTKVDFCNSYNEIGHCLMRMNKLDEAIDCFKQSLHIYEQTPLDVNTDRQISIILNNIGRCLMGTEKLDDAMDHFQRSLEIPKRISPGIDSDREISITLKEIGCCYKCMSNLDKAMKYLKKSMEIQKFISPGEESYLEIAITFNEIGECSLLLGDFSKAMNYFKKSMEVQKKLSSGFDSDPVAYVSFRSMSWCFI